MYKTARYIAHNCNKCIILESDIQIVAVLVANGQQLTRNSTLPTNALFNNLKAGLPQLF